MEEKKNLVRNKKQMFIIIGAFILTLLLGTVTYAFFNYTRTGSSNVIKTGRIAFNAEQGQSINLTNMFPIDVSQGIPDDATKVGTVTIHVTGDTTYSEGMEYLVTAVNVTNTVGNKSLPISIDVSVESNTSNNPATTLGSSDADYFTNRGPSASTSIYKKLADETITNNGDILVGYIKSGATGVDGNIVIKAYIDEAKVVISDTYPEENEDANNDGYIDGTPTSFGEGKTVFTTTEWNSLQQNGVSFQIKVESQEGTWVDEPIVPICRRVTDATLLHIEECENSIAVAYCQFSGYQLNSLITYGTAKPLGSQLQVGDAFDCDVNGDGNYNERFYYVSNYYDTSTKTFDNTTATLIYYSNTISGTANTGGSAYYGTANENWHGPVTALNNLPTTSQWSNINLKVTTRTILACDDVDCSNDPVSTINSIEGSANIDNPFDYSGYAARLLTLSELKNAGCEVLSGKSSLGDNGAFNSCAFLYEGTQYSSFSNSTSGFWLETPNAVSSYYIMNLGESSSVRGLSANTTSVGVRPAIDVPINKLDK